MRNRNLRCLGIAASIAWALLLFGCAVALGVVDFTADRTAGTTPLAVAFHAIVSARVTSYAWDFGDGGSSAEADPVHVYTQAGTYSVTLTVAAAAGSVTARKADFIHVTGAPGSEAVFWIERGSGTIHRSPLDGGSSTVVLSGLIGPEDLVVAGGRMYWTDPGAGTVESADLDGANRRIISLDQNYPTGVAVDVARDRVYWTTLPSAADASPAVEGAVRRAHLDGTGAETLATFSPSGAFAWQIAVDPRGAKLYWLANDWVGVGTSARAPTCRGRIMRSGLDGKSPAALAEGLCGPTDLTLGEAGGTAVYWTDEDAGTISRMAADGSGETILVSGQVAAESIAVSVTTGKVYWTAGSSLLRANADGTGTETLFTGLNLPEGIAVGH